jgi:integrase
MEAFFGCLYYAALRPAEAVALREADCVLPKRGWGRIDLAASQSCAGTGWTDDGASREERGLKHRAPGETRSIPIPPVLVRMLRAHIARYGTSPGGHLFRTAPGGPLNDTGWGEVWQHARPAALTPPSRHPAAPTTSGRPPSPYGSTRAFPPPKSPAAPATA